VYVPRDEVLAFAEREGAISFDAPGARYTHRGNKCSFETLIEEVGTGELRGRHVAWIRCR